MRFPTVIGALLLAACASVGAPPAFAPNQVWTLVDPPSPDARLVIDALETHGDRTVVRYSIVMEPPPEALARGVIGLDAAAAGDVPEEIARLAGPRISEERLNELQNARPVQYRIGSMFFEDGRWRPGGMSVMLSAEPDDDAPPIVAQIGGFAVYDSVLRSDLAALARLETPPEIFPWGRDEQGSIELFIPVEEEQVLNRPLSSMLQDVAAWWRGEAIAMPAYPDPGAGGAGVSGGE